MFSSRNKKSSQRSARSKFMRGLNQRSLNIENLEDRKLLALIHSYTGDGDANDSAGTLDGTFNNTAAYATGVIGQAFDFDGLASAAASNVSIPADSSLDFTTGTVSLWFNAPANSQNESILSMRTSTANGRWSIHVNENSNSVGLFSTAGGFQSVSVPGGITPNTWYHLAAVMTTGSTQFFINGTSIGSTSNGIDSSKTGLPLVIGTPNDAGFFSENFGGEIDELQIYDSALTAGQIAALAVLPGTLSVNLSGSKLTITDTDGTGIDNQWNISRVVTRTL